MTEIRVLNPDLRFALGEGPVWDAANDRVLVADILGCSITAVSLAGTVLNTWHFPSEVGSFGLCRSGHWIVALRHEVVRYDWRARRIEPFCAPGPIPPHGRLNDGKIGPDGAFWVGSMDERAQREPIGRLFRVAPDGTWREIADGLYTANGIAWTADGRTMVHSDSGAPWIDAWDFAPETGAASNRRRIATPDTEAIGRPDGAAFDVAGRYWSAGVRKGRINRFRTDGTLIDSRPFPALGITMPCFCGPDLRSIVWTSLRTPLGAEGVGASPLSGALFIMDSDEPGVPVPMFAD
jgi:sugar lactone lactonase YvrE